jgi:hypothetical protein
MTREWQLPMRSPLPDWLARLLVELKDEMTTTTNEEACPAESIRAVPEEANPDVLVDSLMCTGPAEFATRRAAQNEPTLAEQY